MSQSTVLDVAGARQYAPDMSEDKPPQEQPVIQPDPPVQPTVPSAPPAPVFPELPREIQYDWVTPAVMDESTGNQR